MSTLDPKGPSGLKVLNHAANPAPTRTLPQAPPAPQIDEAPIGAALAAAAHPDKVRIREVLAKAREARGLSYDDVAVLMSVTDDEDTSLLFDTAREVKEHIYGKRLVLFAPLYVANQCCNECTYCAFRARNSELPRRALTTAELERETRALIDQGHKRVLLVAGESYPNGSFDYILDAIRTVYGVRSERGEIRRINVNVAPLSVEEFKELKGCGIGTYQLFQETYHRQTYAQVHLAGKKRDFDWRLSVMDRAMQAGIDDVGIGALFGLYDWRFEVLAMMQHIRHLEQSFGVGPHTISVPRIEPAHGSTLADAPPHAVGDDDFFKLVAILRLAVPYTGIILSTRESAANRRMAFALGISQISAGSRTQPGGYNDLEGADAGQFAVGDHRTLDEVVRDLCELGYIPSYCTACYRLGRTGRDFMDMAKPGDIRSHCDPNALSTFAEYLQDYASPATRAAGEKAIQEILAGFALPVQNNARRMLQRIADGKRDVCV